MGTGVQSFPIYDMPDMFEVRESRRVVTRRIGIIEK